MKDMEALLRRLQARERVDFGWRKAKDWYFDTAGSEFYQEVADFCSNIMRGSNGEVFYEQLKKLQEICTKEAREKKRIRTRALEDEILSLWTPLEPQIRAFDERMVELEKSEPGKSGKRLTILQYNEKLLRHMQWFLAYYNKRYKTS
jgi:hypothetical protein